jgi:hypothetical protein
MDYQKRESTSSTCSYCEVSDESFMTSTPDRYIHDFYTEGTEEEQEALEQLKLEYLKRCEREARRTTFPPVARTRHCKGTPQRALPVSERCSTRYPTGFG